MIIKGRSSTMRHLSRTHRVALGRLFDRINLDLPKSKSNMSTPKTNSPTFEPRAVSLVMSGTIFSFCSTLLNNPMFSCSHVSTQFDNTRAMSKRHTQEKQQGEEVELVVAQSRPARNLVSMTSDRSPTVSSSSSSHSKENLRAKCSTLDSFTTGKHAAMGF